jgi:hypothetical protein
VSLHWVNLSAVSAGFKVGVVGRTGAGKSSLIGALFRLTEIESGCISVDHVNTKALGLKQLRSAMALIPQVCVRSGLWGGRGMLLQSGDGRAPSLRSCAGTGCILVHWHASLCHTAHHVVQCLAVCA